jgi:selenocysteine lyase/cysteine desulfurase
MPRGNFLTFRTKEAGAIYQRLHEQNVIVDHRGDRLRIGFGIYQDSEDVERLAKAFSAL